MKLKIALLLFLPILLTAFFMLASEKNFVGAFAFIMLILAVCNTVLTTNALIPILFLVVSMHWLQLPGMTYSLFLVPVTIVILLAQFLKLGQAKIDKLWFGMISLFIGYMALLVVVRPYKLGLTLFFYNLIALIMFALVSSLKWDAKVVQRFLNIHIAFMFVWAVLEKVFVGIDRIGGPCLSATIYGVMMVASWTIWFINGWLTLKYDALKLALGTVACIAGVVLSGTRMGVIGIALGGVLALCSNFVYKNRHSIKKILISIVVAVPTLLLLGFGIWQYLPEDMIVKKGIDSLLNGHLDGSTLGRIGVWLTALDIIRTDTVWGVGPGNFLDRNKKFLDSISALPYVDQMERLGHAHNVYLMMLSEQGIIGFSVLALCCFTCLFFLIKHIRKYNDGFGFGMFSGGMVILALGMLDVFPLYPSALGWGAWYMGVMFSMRKEKFQ